MNLHASDIQFGDRGCFILSLDMELAWGYYDCFSPDLYSIDGTRERQSVIRILNLLDEYNISATWAVVGELFYQNHKQNLFDPFEREENKYPEFIRMFNDDHPLLFAPDIIQTIKNCKTPQEIGFHGHTHKIFDESLMSSDRAEKEILSWIEIAKSWNIHPKSVVFPQNRIGFLNIFIKKGFKCYRGMEKYPNPLFYSGLMGKLLRRYYYYLTMIYLPYLINIDKENNRSKDIIEIPASRWLFGFNRHLEVILDNVGLHTYRFATLMKGIKKAADEKKIIHVFAHPCEFRTEKDILKLRSILSVVSHEIQQGRMVALTMQNLANYISTINGYLC